MRGLKVASLTAISHFSKLLVALLIIKLIAMTAGPEGLAFLGNYMSLISIVSALAGGGVVTGVVKYLAEYSTDSARQMRFIGNALIYSLVFSILAFLIGVCFINQITTKIFGDLKYTHYILFLLFAQSLVAINNLAYGILNGLQKNFSYALIMVIGNTITILAAYILIAHFGTTGAILAVTLPLVAPLLPILFIYFKKISLLKFSLSLLMKDSANLSRFSLMLIVSAICFPLVEIYIRNNIVLVAGIDMAGIWQGLIRLSSAYLSFFSVFLSFYLVPKISSAHDKRAMWKPVFLMMLSLSLLFACICGVVFFIKRPLIQFALSDSFFLVEEYLMWQMLGDYFRIMGWVIGFVIVAKAATKLYIFSEIFQGLSFMFLASLFLNYYKSLSGVIAGYVLTCFMYFLFALIGFIFFLKKNNVDKVASCKQQ